MTPFIRELHLKSPTRIFAALKHLPYSLFFDSADREHPTGRYSFIVSHPIETIEAKDGEIMITNWEERKTLYEADPFTIVQERLDKWIPDAETIRGLPPFQGGAAGYFGYDLARNLEKLPASAASNPDVPDIAIGIYDQVMAFDHEKNQAWMITHAANYHDARKKQDYILGLIAHPPAMEDFAPMDLEWQSNFTSGEYTERIRKVIQYIKDGDIFQANLAQRFKTQIPAEFDPYAHYLRLREVNPAPFAAFMNCGNNLTLASASPERFLSVKDRAVETRPIKGTRPRSDNPALDDLYKQELKTSAKDRAENTMIVDLLRNDLSKVCVPASVEVVSLCRLESFAGVHHLVSSIKGILRKSQSALDLLKACFPGGSITGAPKIRAMEIIEDMEELRRGPYCGAMAYIGFDGTMDSSILIRTLVYEGQNVSVHAGGGIVADSSPEQEYLETFHKAAAIFRSFEPDDKDSDMESLMAG